MGRCHSPSSILPILRRQLGHSSVESTSTESSVPSQVMSGRPLLQAAKSQVWEMEDSQRPHPESVEEHPKRYLNPYELRALAEDKKREQKEAKERQDELIKSNLLAAKSAGSGTDRVTEGKKVVRLIMAATAAVTSAGSSSQIVENAGSQTVEIAADPVPKNIKTDELSQIMADEPPTDSIPNGIKTDQVEVDFIPQDSQIIMTDEMAVDTNPDSIPNDIKTDEVEVMDSIPGNSQILTDEMATDSISRSEIQAVDPTAPEHVVDAAPKDKNTGEGESMMEMEEEKQHHILDEYEERILRRAEQDNLYIDQGGRKRGRAPKGEGKGRGRGRGRGRAADKSDKDDTHDAERKPAARAKAKARPASAKSKAKNSQPKSKSKKGKAARKLFDSDDETWKEDSEAANRAAPKRRATAAKSAARKSKRNRNGDDQCEAPASGSAGQSAPATPVQAESPAEHAALPPPAPERPSRKSRSKASNPSDAKKEKVPGFNHCQIVPYWSRQACGLKVRDDEGGLRQVFYVGVKGASMKEHLDLISEVVARLIL